MAICCNLDREGKYGQTCVVALQNGALSSNGARQVIIITLMALLYFCGTKNCIICEVKSYGVGLDFSSIYLVMHSICLERWNQMMNISTKEIYKFLVVSCVCGSRETV